MWKVLNDFWCYQCLMISHPDQIWQLDITVSHCMTLSGGTKLSSYTSWSPWLTDSKCWFQNDMNIHHTKHKNTLLSLGALPLEGRECEALSFVSACQWSHDDCLKRRAITHLENQPGASISIENSRLVDDSWTSPTCSSLNYAKHHFLVISTIMMSRYFQHVCWRSSKNHQVSRR